MGSNKFIGLLLVMIAMCAFSSSSQAYKFYVGGKDGWVVKPSEGYNHWAGRNRFQVNDTLYFKYKKGSDSVLVVKKKDYKSCNSKNPIKKMDGGDSSLQLDRSGPFYLISGNFDHCQKGQKIIVVVMAVRQPPPPASAPPSAGPVPSPPAQSPPAAQPSEGPSGSNAPVPSPSGNSNHSGSTRVGGSVYVAVGVSIGAILMIFSGFAAVV